MSSPSTSNIRKVQAYLKPKLHPLLQGYAKLNQISESSAINVIVKDFFTRVPENDKMNYLKASRTIKKK